MTFAIKILVSSDYSEIIDRQVFMGVDGGSLMYRYILLNVKANYGYDLCSSLFRFASSFQIANEPHEVYDNDRCNRAMGWPSYLVSITSLFINC